MFPINFSALNKDMKIHFRLSLSPFIATFVVFPHFTSINGRPSANFPIHHKRNKFPILLNHPMTSSSSPPPTILINKSIFEFRDSIQLERYIQLKELPMVPTFYLDEDDFVLLKLLDDIFQLAVKLQWNGLIFAPMPSYRELTLEFLSSLKYKGG